MSRENENVVEQPVVVNPLEYGFKPGTMVTIPAEIWMANFSFAGAVAHQETKEMIIINEFPLETGPEVDEANRVMVQPERVVIYTSPVGKRGGELFNDNVKVQLELIKQGMAVKMSDVEGPQLDLG